ncbi:MAG: Uma2 family endonuclease, partial [Desulfobacterales bacterium]|nr:Uma2 family endonuclease [Desulfobacterales bacterium]
FHSLLKEYLEVHPDAVIFGTDLGFRPELPGKKVIRKPDMSLILKTNPVSFDLLDRSYNGVFDMCFEFLSDSKEEYAERDTVKKRSEYAGGGVKEYFILDRLGTETDLYRLNRRGFYSPIRPTSGGVIKSKVLPGFQFRIQDLYDRPGFEEMANDPVYKHFVLKKWQAERGRADEAEKRAGKAEKTLKAERKRAGKAEKTALKLAEKLREMGIDPESL